MSHTLVLNVSDDAYEELVRASNQKRQSPEMLASKMLNELLPDPLLKLVGTIKSSVPDVAARHDEYIGDGIHAGHSR